MHGAVADLQTRSPERGLASVASGLPVLRPEHCHCFNDAAAFKRKLTPNVSEQRMTSDVNN